MFWGFKVFFLSLCFFNSSSKLIPLTQYVVFHHTVNSEKSLSNISEIL